MAKSSEKNPPAWSRTKSRPVRLIIFFGLIAVGVRFGLPSSDPFDLYFEQFLKTGGQGRGHTAAARIAQLGERGVEGLRAVLDNPDATGKELGAAMHLAGEINAPELAGRLLELAGTAEPMRIRLAALEGIGLMGGTDAAPVLMQSLADENPAIRMAALRAVGAVEAPELAAQVETLATEGTEAERPEALAALGRLGSEVARESLWRLYNGPLSAGEASAARRALAGFPT
ncbi:MAG: HEAT repeat domain-containing protein, partial [Chrysiogenetes bacterium]|nr:HEAT repeat domain-containing protein [Chrysiogenetes bacterium]